MSSSAGKDKFGSDVIVDAMKAMGFRYAPLNPGASIRGLHDSIVNYGGNENPKLVLCCHEEIAVAIASGYFRACGEPLAVLVHDIEGLLHSTKAVFDAYLEREAMVILGGNGPTDIEKRRPGIDWQHTALVPGLTVRNYTKWDDQPDGIVSTVEALFRAYRIATTDPAGPVYLSLDAHLQEKKLEGDFKVPRFANYPSPTLGEGDLSSIEEAARLLVNAAHPTIIVDGYGRDESSVWNLVKLVEATGAAVIDTGQRFNFPSDHPQNLSGLTEEVLGKSDVVVALGVRDLYHALAKEAKGHFSRESKYMTSEGCKVIRIDTESVFNNSWVADYGRLTPTTMSIVASEPAAVAKLLEIVLRVGNKNASAINERKGRFAELSSAQRKKWHAAAEQQLDRSPITYPALAYTVWQKIKQLGLDWVLSYPGYTRGGINAWVRQLWSITKFYQYPGRGGGTGTGIGRAIGAALANRGRICIDFQPDGDLLYTASSLWTAGNLKLPLVIFVLDNRSYFNDEEHQRAIAEDRGRPVENKTIGIRIEDPNVDFSKMAESYGLHSAGHAVSDTRSLSEILGSVFESLKKENPTPFLIDVAVQPK